MTTRSGVLVGGLLSGPRYVNETTPPRQATGAGAFYLDALAANTGTASVTLGAVTLSATGALRIAGTLTATLADVTASSTGVLPIQGTESKTLDDVTLVATGTLRISGTVSATLADATLTATATLTGTGTGSDLAAKVAAAKGMGGVSVRSRRRRQIIGNAALVLPAYWLSVFGEGEVSDPPEGEFRACIQLDAIWLHARGAVGVRGETSISFSFRRYGIAGIGEVAPFGNARLEIAPIARCVGRHDQFNEAELALLPLLLEL